METGGLAHLHSEQGPGKNSSASRRDVFVMGNSAGGVHLATWLLAPQFKAARRSYLSVSRVVRLSGAVLFSVPFHFENAGAARGDVLKAYYGGAVAQKCPFWAARGLESSRVEGWIGVGGAGDPASAEPGMWT
jgi:hypothetical protein